MKKVGIIIFAVALVIGIVVANFFSFGRATSKFFNFSVNFSGVNGSGNIASETRDVAGFKSVDVGGVFEVEITAQKDFSVEVESDDNILPLISTEVRDGVLKIKTKRRVSPTGPIHIRISAPDIEGLDISGAAKITLNDIKNSNLSVDSSGAAKIKITGETSKLTVDVSGASKIDAEDLNAVDASVEASGACHVSVNVSGDLLTDATGASTIVYSGTPSNIEKKTSGASSVIQK